MPTVGEKNPDDFSDRPPSRYRTACTHAT